MEQLEGQFTKYEVARILGARALQLAMDAPMLKKISEKELEEINYDVLKIAEAELEGSVLPITVKRPFPEKKEEKIKKISKEELKKIEEKKEAEKAEEKKETEVKKEDKAIKDTQQAEEQKIKEEGEIMELAKPADEVEVEGKAIEGREEI